MNCNLPRAARLVGSLAVLASAGCFERRLASVLPCTRDIASIRVPINQVTQVDLLLVVDNSGSMSEEQESLNRELPRLVQALATGNRDEDEELEFPAVESLHVGVISTDMGSNGFQTAEGVSGCNRRTTTPIDFGDDGILRSQGASRNCPLTQGPAVFAFNSEEGLDAAERFADRIECVAQLGTRGCAAEQQLEAALKALSPARQTNWTIDGYIPPLFWDGTRGHADRENDGFVRPDSALAIVLVTDEEDCSLSGPEIFENSFWPDLPFGHRCTDPDDRSERDAPIHAVTRYIDDGGRGGFLGLRKNPGLLVFAGIVGVPQDLAGNRFSAMLSDPRMRYVAEYEGEPGLAPSCETYVAVDPTRPDGPLRKIGDADPARRIVEVAQALEAGGARATIQSICNPDFGPALDQVVGLLGDALRAVCLPRDLNPDAEGLVNCSVFELLPEGRVCDPDIGRDHHAFVDRDGVRREECLVTQVSRDEAENGIKGWLYEATENPFRPEALDDVREVCTPTGQRVRFANTPPVSQSEVRLECTERVTPPDGTIELGTFCDPDADICGTSTTRPGMRCDVVDRTCALPCTGDKVCFDAGLVGQRCDTRTFGTLLSSTALGARNPDEARNVCVRPTCL